MDQKGARAMMKTWHRRSSSEMKRQLDGGSPEPSPFDSFDAILALMGIGHERKKPDVPGNDGNAGCLFLDRPRQLQGQVADRPRTLLCRVKNRKRPCLRVPGSRRRGAMKSNWGTPHAGDAWDHAVRGHHCQDRREDLFGPKCRLASKFSTDEGRADHRAITARPRRPG